MSPKLKTRLEALEAKRKPSEPMAIFIMPAGADNDTIQGFQHGEHVIKRQAGESLESLEARTAEAIRGAGIAIIRALVA